MRNNFCVGTPRINKLNESDISKIAAGEVVEDTSSVVKELLENALDAGASVISVCTIHGGIQYISVEDNGHGIYPEDLEKAVLPHCTSKVIDARDIETVSTYGFRGEALSSISSVAKLSIASRNKYKEIGKVLTCAFGEIILWDEYFGNVGTVVEVKDLFFKMHARRSFLPSIKALDLRIKKVINEMLLLAPNVELTWMRDKTPIYFKCIDEKNCQKKIWDRMQQVIGQEPEENWVYVCETGSVVSVHGFVSSPSNNSVSRGQQFIFINNRSVLPGYWSKVIKDAYKYSLSEKHMVGFVLFLEIEPRELDVNVHPRKLEVRFKNLPFILKKIVFAIRSTIFKDYNLMLTNLDIVENKEQLIDIKTPNKIQKEYKDLPVLLEDGGSKHQEAKNNVLSLWQQQTPYRQDLQEMDQETVCQVSEQHRQQKAMEDNSTNVAGDRIQIFNIIKFRFIVFGDLGYKDRVFVLDVLKANFYDVLFVKHHKTYIQMLLVPIEVRVSNVVQERLNDLSEFCQEIGIELVLYKKEKLYIIGTAPWIKVEGLSEKILSICEDKDLLYLTYKSFFECMYNKHMFDIRVLCKELLCAYCHKYGNNYILKNGVFEITYDVLAKLESEFDLSSSI